jgi:bifunctional non-homologous end joining protein LigD
MAKFLDEYNRKRSPERTPEPFSRGERRPGIFVVQKHSATRLHYDLRLEWDGALKSWAVPRGPSPDPAEKRLAQQTEDHPVEYADFEGTIPKGEYGAGPMIVWDIGRWRCVGDPNESVAKGKLLFELRGNKLKGMWTLVKMKEDRAWLLIKETGDAHVRRGGTFDERSVYSGRLLEEAPRIDEVRRRLVELKAPRVPMSGADITPMLAETSREAFDDPNWIFEVKYDGFRAIVERDGGRSRIYYRRGAESTTVYPDLAHALKMLPAQRFVADGEITVPDETGRPVFQRLQKRALLTEPLDIERASYEFPAVLFLFDLLGFEDFDLRPLPLIQRKELLHMLVPSNGIVRAIDHVPVNGKALYSSIRELGLEGIMAKRVKSPYRGGRSADWQKIRSDQTGDFVVVGFTQPDGHRDGFGALHLAQYQGDQLLYLGRAGGGFSDKELKTLHGRLLPLQVPRPLCVGPIQKSKQDTWVKPELVVEVRYKEITEEGLLRQPAFLRSRDDKPPGQCITDLPLPESAPVPTVSKELSLSNLDKVFWPEQGYTKGDLIEYYRAISPWLLPYLKDRPLVLTRYPDGIAGKSFFQKDAPHYVPSWIRTERIPGGGGFSREPSLEDNVASFFICDDLESLLYLINLGTIPLHTWSSRAATLMYPDWCIIDLDPKTAPFKDVLTLAKATHELCEEIGIPSYIKTSGQKGLHILLPMGNQLDHSQSTTLAELIARAVESRYPKISSTERQVKDRGGKVYLDFLQNGYGKTIAGPFSARPIPAASVSMPLKWSEVNARLDPSKFTIANAPARLKKLKEDPIANVLTDKPDIQAVLAKLSALIK